MFRTGRSPVAAVLAGLFVIFLLPHSAAGQRRNCGGARGSFGIHRGGPSPRSGGVFRGVGFDRHGHAGFGSSHRFGGSGFHHFGRHHRVGFSSHFRHHHGHRYIGGHCFGVGVHYPYTFFRYPYYYPSYGDYYWKYPRYSIGYTSYRSEPAFIYRHDDYWPANDALTGFAYEEEIIETESDHDEPDPFKDDAPSGVVGDAESEKLWISQADEGGPSPEGSIHDSALERSVGIAIGRGDRAFEAGEYDLAREEYVRALVLAGDDSGARIALGLAEYALGSCADAAIAIRRGVAISPRLAESTFDLRTAYGDGDDYAAHRRALEAFAHENPDDQDAEFLLGFVQYFSGELDAGAKTWTAHKANADHDASVNAFLELAIRRAAAPETPGPDSSDQARPNSRP